MNTVSRQLNITRDNRRLNCMVEHTGGGTMTFYVNDAQRCEIELTREELLALMEHLSTWLT